MEQRTAPNHPPPAHADFHPPAVLPAPRPSALAIPHLCVPLRSLPPAWRPSRPPPSPPPLPWLAWVASPHYHAPSGREVDGALSRPSRQTEWGAKHVPDYRAPCTPGTAFRFVKGRCESCYQSSALVSSHIRAPRHLHRLVCECLSATKGERGRGRIDSIARSQKGTSASGQGGPH